MSKNQDDPQAKIENLDTRCAYRDTARIRSINSPSLLSEPQGADDKPFGGESGPSRLTMQRQGLGASTVWSNRSRAKIKASRYVKHFLSLDNRPSKTTVLCFVQREKQKNCPVLASNALALRARLLHGGRCLTILVQWICQPKSSLYRFFTDSSPFSRRWVGGKDED